MTLLIDIGGLHDEGCACALEELHKALSMPSGDDDIWRPHESLFIRSLIEQATAKGVSALDSLKLELLGWLKESKTAAPAPKPVIPNGMTRWSETEAKAAKAYLEGIPKELWSADDYMLLVDYLVNKHLPPDFAVTQADWLAKRAVIMGRVQAALAVISAEQADALMAEYAKKGALDAVLRKINFHDAMLSFGEAKIADYIVGLTDAVRHKTKSAILDFELGRRLGVKQDNSSLEQKLFDNFAEHNRDWRRIALTEAGELANNAFIANVAPGGKVKRIEQYANACPFCKKWNGAVLTVVAPDAKEKDWDTQVWVGKTNYGRSASPYKRVGGVLVKRDDAEMLKPSSGVFHPHCFVSGQVPIYTSTGWVKIKNIRIGDLVLTHKGRFRPVNWVMGDDVKYNGEVVEILSSYHGKNVAKIPKMTTEHPVLTNKGWVNAGDLNVGDSIVALAKSCAQCGKIFINAKHPHVSHCSLRCVKHSGKNQFSTNDPDKYLLEVSRTADANRKRMRNMTIEQRRELTSAGRSVMSERGYEHLCNNSTIRKAASSCGSRNYTPSETEIHISSHLSQLGFRSETQYRISRDVKDSLGRKRYWFADIALPDQKIDIEIDGEPWHGRLSRDGRDSDRDEELKSLGWTVLRFNELTASQEPARISDEIARIAMNHSGEYIFGEMKVERIVRESVSNRRLYNFGVEDDESYIIGRGVVVHNCRGRWVALGEGKTADEFSLWLDGFLAKQTAKHAKK